MPVEDISKEQLNKKRVLKNTVMLYVRMLVLMMVSFFTTRVIIRSLGEIDFGVNNAVGGFVALFGVLTSSLNAAISRFMTFEMGRKDQERLNRVFSTAVIIQIIMAFVVAMLVETVGMWFLDNYMTIPLERINAAHWVLHFAVINTFITITFIPYSAAIISHERMDIYAYVSILESCMHLVIALLIVNDFWSDKLIFYSGLTCLTSIVINLVYRLYCKKHFVECKLRKLFDKSLLNNIGNFAGWNMFGAVASVLRSHGINLLFNIFFGPSVNAARGVSNQASGVATKFSSGFMTALYPQITKSYASGDHKYMYSLISQGTRMGFALFFLIALPIFIETKPLLMLWLGSYPDHTVAFIRIALVILLFDQILSGPQSTALLATGRIRNYQIVIGGLLLANFPIALVLLKLGSSAEVAMVTVASVSLICIFLRLWFLKNMMNFPVDSYLVDVLLRIFIVIILSSIPAVCCHLLLPDGILYSILNCIIAFASAGLFVWFVDITKNERSLVLNKILNVLRKTRQG